MSNRILTHLNLDLLIASMEARPATRTRTKAWQWLAELSTVTFDGAALVVASATWSATSYLSTPDTCTCPARGHCWHKEAAGIVAAALAADAQENAAFDAAAERDLWWSTYEAASTEYHAIAHYEATEAVRTARAAAKAKAYADVAELFA